MLDAVIDYLPTPLDVESVVVLDIRDETNEIVREALEREKRLNNEQNPTT
jgi:translation elongation factor EF-G